MVQSNVLSGPDLRVVKATDERNISILLEASYGRSYEAQLLQKLRSQNGVVAEFLLQTGTEVIGQISFVEHSLPSNWWILSSLSVVHAHRGRGYGGDLIRCGLSFAKKCGVQAVTVLGATGYYRRFGFQKGADFQLKTPYSIDHTQLYPLQSDISVEPIKLIYPEAFSRL